MSEKSNLDGQFFFSEEWGRDLFKYPEEERREKRPGKEKENCIVWFKRFMKEGLLPTDISNTLNFVSGGITIRAWRTKENTQVSGFIARYTTTTYLFQLENTRTKVFVGVKKIDAREHVEREKRVAFVVEMAKDIFKEGVVQSGGKELKTPHILEETEDFLWGFWSPAETGPVCDKGGALVGYELGGKSPNQVDIVMFQTNGDAVRYEITKRLPASERFGRPRSEDRYDDHSGIIDLVVTEDKDATYIAYPEEDRFFDTLWGGELFSFSGEETMKQYPQPPTHEKHEMIGQIKQIVKEIYVPPDIHQHLFYIPKGAKEVDLSSNTFREKDGFMVRYLIGSYLIQIEKTNSEFFVGVKPIETKDYLNEMTDRINMVREIAEEVLKDGLVPKDANASYFYVKVHNEDLTYGWFRSQDESIRKIEFLTDGYGLRLEIRTVRNFVI